MYNFRLFSNLDTHPVFHSFKPTRFARFYTPHMNVACTLCKTPYSIHSRLIECHVAISVNFLIWSPSSHDTSYVSPVSTYYRWVDELSGHPPKRGAGWLLVNKQILTLPSLPRRDLLTWCLDISSTCAFGQFTYIVCYRPDMCQLMPQCFREWIAVSFSEDLL